MISGLTFLCVLSALFLSSSNSIATEPSYSAMLVNSREITEAMGRQARSFEGTKPYDVEPVRVKINHSDRQIPFPLNAILEKDALCHDLGFGCLVLNVLDDPEKTTLFWHPTKNSDSTSKSQDGEVSSETFLGYFQRAVFLRAYVDESRDRRYGNRPSTVYGSAFSQNKLTDFNAKFSDDQAWLNQNLNLLKDTPINVELARKMARFMMMHPRAFPKLPALYKEISTQVAAGKQGKDLAVFLEYTLKTSLLLTLDSFVKIANSQSPLYPYANDSLTTKGTLLDLDRLYSELKAQNRWPRLAHLSEKVRQDLGPLYQDQHQHGNYSAHGVYDPQTNQIYLDFTRPFYENVYTLFHELWHVAAFHSPVTSSYSNEVAAALALPKTEESQELIRQTVLRFLAEHELLAIDQSNRLFRATGHLAEQWSGAAPSIKGWHDSYFGTTEESNTFIPLSHRRVSTERDFAPNPVALAFLIPAFIELPLKQAHNRRKFSNIAGEVAERQLIAGSLPEYLTSRVDHHLELFKSRYLKDITRMDPRTLTEGLSILKSPYAAQVPVDISCKDVERLVEAMGDYTRFGFPFLFQIESGYIQCRAPSGGLLALSSERISRRIGLPSLSPFSMKGSSR